MRQMGSALHADGSKAGGDGMTGRCECLARYHEGRLTDDQPWCSLEHGHAGPEGGEEFGELRALSAAIHARATLEAARVIQGARAWWRWITQR